MTVSSSHVWTAYFRIIWLLLQSMSSGLDFTYLHKIWEDGNLCVVYVVEKDAHPCRPLTRVRRAMVWEKVDETAAFSFFFSFWLEKGRKEGHFQQPNHISTQGWRRPLGVILVSPMWNILQGCCLSGFSSSKMLPFMLLQGWGNLSKFHWLV